MDRRVFVDQIIEKLTTQKLGLALSTIEKLDCEKKAVKNKRDRLLAYLTNNKRINYGKFKEDGLLIGPSHANGGIPAIGPSGRIELEGGEGILSRRVVQQLGEDGFEALRNGNGAGITIVINVNALDPRSQAEEIRELMEELHLTGRLSVA